VIAEKRPYSTVRDEAATVKTLASVPVSENGADGRKERVKQSCRLYRLGRIQRCGRLAAIEQGIAAVKE
jgi:hypothetical protein